MKINKNKVMENKKKVAMLAVQAELNDGTEFLFNKVKAPHGCSSGTQRFRSNGSVCSVGGDLFNLIKTANR